MSEGATRSPKPTTNFANCLTLIMYFLSSPPALIIFVHRATLKLIWPEKGILAKVVLLESFVYQQRDPIDQVVPDLCQIPLFLKYQQKRSGVPVISATFFVIFLMSSSTCFNFLLYGPEP
jgi:hypothetical protein